MDSPACETGSDNRRRKMDSPPCETGSDSRRKKMVDFIFVFKGALCHMVEGFFISCQVERNEGHWRLAMNNLHLEVVFITFGVGYYRFGTTD